MQRMRRLRVNENMRSLVRETSVEISDLVYPIFVEEGENIAEPIPSMPGINRYSIDRIDEELDRVAESGVKSLLIFGIPKHKDECGSEAYNDNGITQQAIRHIKEKYDMLVIADVCLCEYTSHGHCGLIHGTEILNDQTLDLLCKMSVSLAKAGADIIAPSDMMDGRVLAIRNALDENGFKNTPIMSYAVKYASSFYSPFRDAAGSAPSFGDRKSYQMDYHNRKEGIKEALQDVEEGADIIMVKPAMSYLDIVREVADIVDVPVATYSVSGEYAMVKAAAKAGCIDEEKIVCEMAAATYRAGSSIYLTYFAEQIAEYMDKGLIG